jgi:small subunit ribosomal protein S20
MPITSSAKKALRASDRKVVFNIRRTKAMDTVIKDLKKLVVAGKKEEARKLLPAAYKALDKAAKSFTIVKNTASRLKSRLSKMTK